jgi:GrpB-like predicted nucleotidyltransferase (UPF0157 family)
MRRIADIVEYDCTWPEACEQEARAIRATLDAFQVECFHIGSTAISGMRAKPVIDIPLSLQDVSIALGKRELPALK